MRASVSFILAHTCYCLSDCSSGRCEVGWRLFGKIAKAHIAHVLLRRQELLVIIFLVVLLVWVLRHSRIWGPLSRSSEICSRSLAQVWSRLRLSRPTPQAQKSAISNIVTAYLKVDISAKKIHARQNVNIFYKDILWPGTCTSHLFFSPCCWQGWILSLWKILTFCAWWIFFFLVLTWTFKKILSYNAMCLVKMLDPPYKLCARTECPTLRILLPGQPLSVS